MAHIEKDGPSTTPQGETAPGGTATRGRRGRSAIVAGAAVVAIGVAGAVIYANFPDDLLSARPTPQPAAAPAPPARRELSDAPDSADARTRLALVLFEEGGAGKAAVALGRAVGPVTKEDVGQSLQDLLLREIVRQALLIAARDELGLATRDEVLDDLAPQASEGRPVELSTVFRKDGTRALIRRGGGEAPGAFLKVDLGKDPEDDRYPARLARQAEGLSRKEFVAALKGLGASGSANAIRAAAPVPAKVEERLSGLGLVEHVAAIRDLHAAIRADGESPERLVALARAYAQLGALSEFHYSGAHKVFKARAVLYAERLAAREPGSARALWGRAFAWGVAGLHAEALESLEAAKKAGAGGPPWGPVLEAYLRSDLPRLKAEEGPPAKLAALLRMLALEYPLGTRAAVLAARDVLGRDADCYRAYDVICASGQLGDQHVTTVAGPEAFTKLFLTKLGGLESLPAGVRAKVDKADELGAVAALAESAAPGRDAGEPSWGAIAHLARETRFAQVERRLHFMRYAWSVPVDDYWAGVHPFVAGHRALVGLEAMALAPPEFARTASRDFDVSEVEPTWLHLIQALRAANHPAAEIAGAMAFFHSDCLARDRAALVWGWQHNRAYFARTLLGISPYSAYAMATLVEDEWEKVKGDVPAWREKVGDAPALLAALGKREAKEKRYDEAAKLLARAVELSPDRGTYEALANCYEAKGDLDRWKSTLDDYLEKTEDAGLEHAQVRVKIANHYMSNGRYAEAKPYAEAAAKTWAQWAMSCAAQCAEGLGDLDEAELWTRRVTERYPNTSWSHWFYFCKRTGHGDLAAARAWTDAYVEAVADRPDLLAPETAGYYFWLSGSPRKALDALARAAATSPSPSAFISLAILADELGEKPRCDEALAKVCGELKDKAPKSAAICGLIRDSIAGKGPLDTKAIDAIVQSIAPDRRGNNEMFIGRYLLNHGHTDLGRKYLRDCAQTASEPWLKLLAADALTAPDPPKEL